MTKITVFILAFILSFDYLHADMYPEFPRSTEARALAQELKLLSNESSLNVLSSDLTREEIIAELRASRTPAYEIEALVEELDSLKAVPGSESSSKAAPIVIGAAVGIYRTLQLAHRLYTSGNGRKVKVFIERSCLKAVDVYKKAQSKFKLLGKCEIPTSCSRLGKDDPICLQETLSLISLSAELSDIELKGRSLVLDLCAKSGFGRNSQGDRMEVEGHATAIRDVDNRKKNCLEALSTVKSRLDRVLRNQGQKNLDPILPKATIPTSDFPARRPRQ